MIWTPAKLETLRGWLNRGLNFRQAGKKMGVSKGSVCGIVHRSGLEYRGLKWRLPLPLPTATIEPLTPGHICPDCSSNKQPGRGYCAEHLKKRMPERTRDHTAEVV